VRIEEAGVTKRTASPPVYAIVVNYNGWRDTIECLESLFASDYRPLRVFVCDNASTDDSLERIRDWAVSRRGTAPVETTRAALESGGTIEADLVLVACGGNLGFAGANNVAFRYVLGREPDAFALLFNNDAVIAPDAIAALVAECGSDASIGAVGATIHPYSSPHEIEALGGARISRVTGMSRMLDRPGDAAGMDYVTGCCVLVPRHALATVGLMDERYFLYGEDADWGLRFAAHGLRLVHCPRAHVRHKGGATVGHRSPLHDYYDVRGRLMLVHKHFPRMLPLALVHSAGRCLLPKLVRGEWKRLAAAMRGYGDFLRFARSA
jgi:GT2 family glycosyltransferase